MTCLMVRELNLYVHQVLGVSHEVATLSRIINRYGAYLGHLISLTEDPSVKPVDKQRLKVYSQKWHEGRIPLGCTTY